MAKIPTVKIKTKDFDGGFVVINKSDFDPDEHKLYDDSEGEAKPDAEEDEAPKSFKLEDHASPDVAAALREAGFRGAVTIARASVEELSEVKGIGKRTAERLIEAASEFAPQSEDDDEEGDAE